jgi:beta-N-acetylhexosaminidase
LTRIHERAIAADPHVVTDVANHYCAGLWETGVRCTLKHFPGLGRVYEDTHRESANLSAEIAELVATDWVPFRALMPGINAFTMLGHVRLTAIDRQRPASFSRPVVAGLLRGDWNSDGILVTDDFCMAAVTDSREGVGGASVAALNAGVDLILVSYDSDQFYPMMHALLKADAEGRLRPDALRDSDRRLAGVSPLPPDSKVVASP